MEVTMETTGHCKSRRLSWKQLDATSHENLNVKKQSPARHKYYHEKNPANVANSTHEKWHRNNLPPLQDIRIAIVRC
jgi:hypothetical protein